MTNSGIHLFYNIYNTETPSVNTRGLSVSDDLLGAGFVSLGNGDSSSDGSWDKDYDAEKIEEEAFTNGKIGRRSLARGDGPANLLLEFASCSRLLPYSQPQCSGPSYQYQSFGFSFQPQSSGPSSQPLENKYKALKDKYDMLKEITTKILSEKWKQPKFYLQAINNSTNRLVVSDLQEQLKLQAPPVQTHPVQVPTLSSPDPKQYDPARHICITKQKAKELEICKMKIENLEKVSKRERYSASSQSRL